MKKTVDMDRKLIAIKQQYEIQYIHIRYGYPVRIIEEVIRKHGHSRKKVMGILKSYQKTYECKTPQDLELIWDDIEAPGLP